MKASAGVLVMKRIRCYNSTCATYKSGGCFDVGQQLFRTSQEGAAPKGSVDRPSGDDALRGANPTQIEAYKQTYAMSVVQGLADASSKLECDTKSSAIARQYILTF